MEISFFRSSSYNQYDYCQMSYYITYNLGHNQPSQKKANLGTISHKVFEVLANCKKTLQDNPKKRKFLFDDEELGKFEFTLSNLYSMDYVYGILDRAYEHYTTNTPHVEYTKSVDFPFCEKMVLSGLQHCNGLYDPRNRNIVQAEPGFDLVIDEPWADLGGYKLRIKGTIDLVTQADEDTLEIIDWKGLPIETPIPTPKGWTTMGDLKIGDAVFDKDGLICKVIGKSLVKNKPCYKISFDDKTNVICDNEHLWYLNDGSVVPVTELKIGNKIPLTKPVQYKRKKLPIDPYVLGVWLGNGRNRNGEITGADSFVFEEIQRRGYKLGNDIGCGENCETRTIFDLIPKLRKLNVLNNKHIPEIYLKSSINQRIDLLRGLMDTDGNANPTRKQAVFTTCTKDLSDSVKKLLISLGQRPNQANITRDTNFKSNVKVYPISFRPIDINPFLTPVKASRILKSWGYGKSNVRTIKNIELIENKNTQCIAVDSSSNTYLCTENMIVTHNTGQRKDWATGETKDEKKLQQDFQLLLYYYAAGQIFPKYKNRIMTIFFLRDGGPFTICFDENSKKEVFEKMRKRLNEILSNKNPKPINKWRSDFRCKRLCHYYKTNWPGTETNMCQYVENHIKLYGIEKTSKELKNQNFTVGHYVSPGSIK